MYLIQQQNLNNITNFTSESYAVKSFLQINRYFDLKTKTNGNLNNLLFFPINFNSQVTLPLVLTFGNSTSKLKLVLICLNIIQLFTNQKSFLKKRLVMQQIKKKNSGFIIQTKTFKQSSFDNLYYYMLTILPYMRVSYGIEWCAIVTDGQGTLTFALNDITFFAQHLDEKHLSWERKFFFSFEWVTKIINKKKKRFFFLPFIKCMLDRVLWSSINFWCNRGHGGWTTFSKFSKTIFFYNNLFFSKNFRF